MLTKLSKTLLIATTAMAGLSFGASNAAQPDCQMPDQLTQDSNGIYQIGTCGDLYKFADMVNNGQNEISARLTADIRVNGSNENHVLNADGTLNGNGKNFTQWTPMGTAQNPFLGIFDGNGHTISGLYVNNTNAIPIGLFGIVGRNPQTNNSIVQKSKTTIKNVSIVDSYFKGYFDVGGIAGNATYANISNCNINANLFGELYTGGIVGNAAFSIITNILYTGHVQGNTFTGGLAGSILASKISNSISYGFVSGESKTGALTGEDNNSAFTNNYYNSDFYSGATSGNHTPEKDMARITTEQLMNGKIPEGLDDNIWEIGSSSLDENNTVTYILPHLKAFDHTQKPFIKGKFNIKFKDKDFYNLSAADFESVELVFDYYRLEDRRNVHIFRENGLGKSMTVDGRFHNVKFSIDYSGKHIFIPKKDDGGIGYYEISNKDELSWFANIVNNGETDAKGKLVADIDVNNTDEKQVIKANGDLNGNGSDYTQWVPIGTNPNPYIGVFEGNGHFISGLYFNNDEAHDVGLFGIVGTKNNAATIRNLGVKGSFFKGKVYVAGIVADLENGTVSNCYSNNTLISKAHAGGIVALNFGNINDCLVEGHISGIKTVMGGIVSQNEGYVKSCLSMAIETGTEEYIGGVIGLDLTVSLKHSYYNKDFFLGTAFTDYREPDYPAGKTVRELSNGKLPEGLKEGIWTAGSFKEGKDGLFTYKLPTLTMFATKTQFEHFGSFAVELEPREFYNSYRLTKDDIKSVQLQIGENVISNKEDVIFTQNDMSKSRIVKGTFHGHDFSFNLDTAKILILKDGVYQIRTAEDLKLFAKIVNNGDTKINAKLTADIRMNGSAEKPVLNNEGTLNGDGSGFEQWTPIGTAANPYEGNFDGNGHTISGLYINDENANNVGLFGIIEKGSVQKLGVSDSYFKGKVFVGGLAGRMNNNSSLSSSYFDGYISGITNIGGLAGNINVDASISYCYSAGFVNGNNNVGGMVGSNLNGSISQSYSISIMSKPQNPYFVSTGGIVGFSSEGSINTVYYFKDGDIDAIGVNDNTTEIKNVKGLTTSEFMDKRVIDGLDPEIWYVGYHDIVKNGYIFYYPLLHIFGLNNYIYSDNLDDILGHNNILKKEFPASDEDSKDYGKKEPGFAQADLPKFSVSVSGRTLSISGAQPNTTLDVFDMQGKKVKSEAIHAESFEITLPNVGVYVVKNGYAAKRINVK